MIASRSKKPHLAAPVLCLFVALSFSPLAQTEEPDPDMAAAVKQAEEQATNMGLKMPDMKAQMAEIEAHFNSLGAFPLRRDRARRRPSRGHCGRFAHL